MGRGASYRPQYANDSLPLRPQAGVWRPRGNQFQHIGQGDYVSLQPTTFDAYAVVDLLRSYRDDNFTHSGERNRSLNPTASGFSPADALTNHLLLEPASHFQPYQPLRFSNGTSEARLVQSLKNSDSDPFQTESRRTYSTRSSGPLAPLQNSLRDCPLPSNEPWEDYAIKVQAQSQDLRRDIGCRSTPRHSPQRTVLPPPAPEATEVYLAQARLPSVRRPHPKKCLVVLDLNGTCIARPNLFEPQVFMVRPGIHKLFDYLFEHHVVMIFTSMQRKNAAPILEKLFTPLQREKLAGFWARDKLGLTVEQLHVKTQTYKNLIPIWLDKDVQSTHPASYGMFGWDQSNTVLVDDSHSKAVSHPHNLLLVPEFSKKDAAKTRLHPAVEKSEEAILQSLILKLEELKFQTDVSRLILQWQTGKAPIPRELRSSLAVQEKMTPTSEEAAQLLTPENTIDMLSENSQDNQVYQKLSAHMQRSADEDRQERGVSEVPETVWAELLRGPGDKS